MLYIFPCQTRKAPITWLLAPAPGLLWNQINFTHFFSSRGCSDILHLVLRAWLSVLVIRPQALHNRRCSHWPREMWGLLWIWPIGSWETDYEGALTQFWVHVCGEHCTDSLLILVSNEKGPGPGLRDVLGQQILWIRFHIRCGKWRPSLTYNDFWPLSSHLVKLLLLSLCLSWIKSGI